MQPALVDGSRCNNVTKPLAKQRRHRKYFVRMSNRVLEADRVGTNIFEPTTTTTPTRATTLGTAKLAIAW
ncbi:hypothetical protein KIN20_002612 [Parelaphostrongylus tenuis]|uniref:Uncharacterized protein n=1 Tax=Parelaphostrongylus tenuis TaxID=148309 RepID=A0AAD5LW21_PARTN|nr:hypothetical protein KIN20_002612 [Parelaphostrongylus tenuis]